MNEEKPWLFSDDFDEGVIAGNRAGLEKLRVAISTALQGNAKEVPIGVEESDIRRVLFTQKQDFVVKDDVNGSLWEKLVSIGLAIWFLVLPFVGIGSLVYLVFIQKPEYANQSYPLQSPVLKGVERQHDIFNGKQP